MPAINSSPLVVRENRRFDSDRDVRAHHGWFNSHRDGQRVPYRGTLACHFLELVDMHPKVCSINSKPEPIQWWNGTNWDLYRARYALTLKTRTPRVFRTVDVEVVSDAELRADKAKWNRIRNAYRIESRCFRIFTNRSIRAEPRLTNAMIVNSHSGPKVVSHEDREAVRHAIEGLANFTINSLVEKGVLSYARTYGAVLNMVASGELSFALTRQFDGDTPVSRRG